MAKGILNAIEAAVIFLFPANPFIAITLRPLDKPLKGHNNMISSQLQKKRKKIE